MTQTGNVDSILIQAYSSLSSGDMAAASAWLEKALTVDFDHPEILFAMKCEAWWLDSMQKAQAKTDLFDIGEAYLHQWKLFNAFLSTCTDTWERVVLAYKQFAFSKALASYEQLLQDGEANDPEISFRIGRCQKGIGNYEQALKHLEAATRINKDDPAILAELADLYGLINEPRASKALFREAFFLNPQRIDLEMLESDVMGRLEARTRENNRNGHEVVEWIPIFAEVSGVFSVKRELKPIEVSKLKNSIYELESELNNDGSRRAVLVPRLINKYFWLTDHLISVKEEKPKIDEILLKIKLLDPTIYKLYVA
ncbi:MAG: hypothetical protein A2087_05600 [Spirochaetes bacterium GWD1_61_31]|nr:MAG: hypothetical protein A2Y37_03590 [Spirochaetes bacterium GWB1_60_80]OHD35110.1 MAG: hypothetical protein A2004_05345 [Spirochaetes bacterium GWC1_61_12]OHD43629.1 MAG: hypothetical protein A2087_05600 [Spirochaetes bacterium GWD1_61_31]OHD44121.1 MAG: hypothetical protein A2Y35_02025 [Spirochaetes bacterium GWE1_60_18]OHD61838.1 MAG: hypothetical protein A2Y32_13850 [Spirochaetes bacterium GWF1_60_12]